MTEPKERVDDPIPPGPIPPEPTEEERREDDRPDQIGIIPGKVPGRPVEPGDPRFPGSQPDLA
ncbi:hypothetical protein [Azospirillum rugosum]|uniref:Uncharacterized protein n=1 Tax=Azospirillum rugosum TaxID=416170 RepID=A0ABS4SIU4_9PROT|nr:hypothetical protein [Azospirillum rugosum]MBP2292484.1 hypothetical protein [Azospirillum rugosum]MDQ0526243.1 hypothetical protein [Azospirillum rugosum]